MNQPRKYEVAQLGKPCRLQAEFLLVVCNTGLCFVQFELFRFSRIFKVAISMVTQYGIGSGFEPGWGYEIFRNSKSHFFGKVASAGRTIASALNWGANSSIV